MIKVCSLNFLNKEFFETDVKTAQGVVLCKSGDKITPEILLKLYFKDVYIDEQPAKAPATKNIDSIETSKEKVAAGLIESEKSSVNDSPPMKNSNFVGSSIASDKPEDTTKGPRFVEGQSTDINNQNKYAPAIDNSITAEAVEKIAAEEAAAKVAAEAAEKAAKEEAERKIIEEAAARAAAEAAAKAAREEAERIAREEAEAAARAAEEEAKDRRLVFDESQAKKMVENSIKIGKLLNYSEKELKELEQVAYYYNIGITNFRQSDLKNLKFRKMKIYASYQKILDEETASPDIAEKIKQCANNYESSTFPLNSKIPYSHIVSITGTYEELLENNSKQETLLKMLQMGGNHFNTFVLHKFINMIRESNG